MPRATRLLVVTVLAAVAVPLVPLAVFGMRLDAWVAAWLATEPPAPMLAAAEVGVLAADILLPVPSSLVATFGGAVLGIPLGTLCAWLGMTIGSLAGWALGRFAVDGLLFKGGEDFEAFDDASEGGVLAVEVGGVAEHEEE
jgi:uncharacterized membrane protein YdjX (TVP38/TMEM64 family)